MGCTNSTKKSFIDDELRTDGKGLNNSAYASSEFDLPTSDSDDEMLSVSIFNNNKDTQNLSAKKTITFASGLTTTNNNTSSIATTSLLDNRISQTAI